MPPPRVYDARLRTVLPDHARLLSLYEGASWAEGPVWWPTEDALVFSDVVGRRTLAWRDDGSVVSVVDPSAFANGNAVDGAGRLVHASPTRCTGSPTRERGIPPHPPWATRASTAGSRENLFGA
ncbi:MAG: gluconolactonase [Microbacterium sp.]|nr:gluconolactonase [Microbacterium sp.]